MKRFKSLSVKNKRVLAIAGVSVVALGVVGTIAYNQDWMNFANIFRPASDVVEFSETFDSPDDWQPCQEIPKTAIATNKNASPRYVRMKINEYWRTKNSQTPTTDHETTDLALTWMDNGVEKHYAVINTQNDDKWELGSDGWYYYKTTLAQDESTDSLLKSVTFNCEVNTVGEIRYALDGSTFEGVSSDYADANYHLYITFQMSDEDMAPKKHEIDCDNATELYDLIACRTNGPDTNVVFKNTASSEGINGWGVNTLDAHKNDFYPVYYFRGDGALRNNVLWDNKCWKIIRTTGTGGVKMSYAGYANNGVCDDNSSNTYKTASIVYSSGIEWFSSPGHYPGPGIVSYSYGSYNPVQESYNESGYSSYDELYFGNDIEWVNGQYHLIDTIHGTWRDLRETAGTRYHYFCFGGSDTCVSGRAGYIIDFDASDIDFYRLTGGKKLEDIKEEIFNGGNVPSAAKSNIEGWFGAVVSRADELEDTIYCQDRTIISGPLKSKDSPWEGNIAKFGAYERLLDLGDDGDYNPSVDCVQKKDSYTVNESDTGNGFLRYPVGMLTADELMLVGYNPNNSNDASNQWFAGLQEWSMTPGWYESRFDGPLMISWNNQMILRGIRGSYRLQIRPVVSLKAGMAVTEGDGSAATPYKIAQ
jgi:alternate signal-mediated exported protein